MPALIAAAALAFPSCHGLTDNILCMPLPRGWHSSVGFGHTPRGPAAWMLGGNFRFSRDAAKHEANPSVPPHGMLIAIGDFPIFGNWGKHWRRVERLHLPSRPASRQLGSWLISWHVRFAHRALYLSVRFGTRPDAAAKQLVNRRLASVRRIG